MSSDLNDDVYDNNYKWTNISMNPKYLIGREALTLSENNQYILRKPIKYGFFNNEYSHQSVVDDLTKIIEYCLINILQINKKSFGNFGIVLLIPDLFIRKQVKALINIFLKTFGFKSIFLHLESVMASFGGALQSACVLDIGSDKINVCCVDEGIILEDTLIRKNYGGDDLTKLLYLLTKRKGSKIFFPYDQMNLNNSYHFRILEKLKESECEFPNLQNPTSQFIPKNCKLWMHRKGNPTKMFNITLSEAAYLTPLSLVNVEIFETIRNVNIPHVGLFNDIYSEQYPDPEDTYEDLIFNLATAQNNEIKKEENVSNIPNNSILNSQTKVKITKENEADESMSVKSDENEEDVYEEHNSI